ncbi:uncharacterized protein RJT20DRAFT_57056 [Scheffersomyces xylosifermentans]|uniref:uncharacterized protein n=1 Tax=Scheffersomyces xylosifermentans TaxID=1304137 RepID=UPI00315C78D7
MRITSLLTVAASALGASSVVSAHKHNSDHSSKHAQHEFEDVSIYELNSVVSPSTPIVSNKDAMSYLSTRFGVSDNYKLGKDASDLIAFIESQYESRQVADADNKPRVVVSVKGVDNPDQFFKGGPSYKVADKNHKLDHLIFNKLPKQMLQAFDEYKMVELTPELEILTTEPESTSVHHFKYFNEQLYKIWESFKSSFGKRSQIVLSGEEDCTLESGFYKCQQDETIAFGNDTVNLINDKLFINELSQLIHLSNTKVNTKDVVFVKLDSLLSLGRKIGQGSSTYQFSKKVLGDYLLSLSDKFDLTVAVTNEENSRYQARLNKREQQLKEVFEVNHFGKRDGAKAASTLYSTEEACQKGTSDCSSHGTCTEVKSGSWSCVCKPSFDKEKSKTTHWVGYDCSKKDISAQANLLLWSGLLLIVFLVGGVQFLFAIGNDPLPGVLDVATLSKKTA